MSNRIQVSYRVGQEPENLKLRVQALHPAQRLVIPLCRALGLVLLLLFLVRHRQRFIDYLQRTDSPGPTHETRIWDGVSTVTFFLVCLQVFGSASVHQILDLKFSTVVSHQLMTAGDLALPSDFSHARGETLPRVLQEVDGKVFHVYPHAIALLNIPFVAAFEMFDVAPVSSDGFFLRHHENQILGFAAAFQAAALCALLFLLARLFLAPLQSLGLATVFAFGTQIFSSVSRPYWSHAWALIFLTAGLYTLLSRRKRDDGWSAVLAATLLSWSFFCRPPMSLSIIVITAFLVAKLHPRLRYFVGTGLAWGALFALYSMRVFNELIPPYFLSSHLESGVLGLETLNSNYLEASLGTLVSPGRGLFIYVPVTALILLAVVRYWRWLPEKALALAALCAIIANWQLLSFNRIWWGGQCFGPRLFADVLPWFFLLAVLLLSAVDRFT
ncbi:MAG: hypothetical protein OEM62_08020, partial [Acidobacteriota bacterium]|nr:hypothetical protein [Acidobacteriota bacterium]